MDFNKKQKNTQLIKLINDSLLAGGEKKTLIDFYERAGATPEFLKKFEDALVAKLKLKTNTAIKLCKSVENEFEKVRSDYNKQIEVLAKGLQKEIDKIEPTNVTARTKLWDAYYAKVDELQNGITAAVQKITQKTLIGFAE